MTLFKATDKGNVPMSQEEEAEILVIWEKENNKPKPVPKQTIDSRIDDIEKRINAIEKAK